MSPSLLEMLAAHLNAPYGALVSADDVAKVLTQGYDGLPLHDAPSASVLASVFEECSASLIERACQEAQLPLPAVTAAYASLVQHGARHVPDWDARLAA